MVPSSADVHDQLTSSLIGVAPPSPSSCSSPEPYILSPEVCSSFVKQSAEEEDKEKTALEYSSWKNTDFSKNDQLSQPQVNGKFLLPEDAEESPLRGPKSSNDNRKGEAGSLS